MRRTLQTAEQSLGWLIKRGVPVILRPGKDRPGVNPIPLLLSILRTAGIDNSVCIEIGQLLTRLCCAEWQENSAKPCDTGTSISVMKKEWPQFDWSTVDPVYPAKTGLYEFSKRGLRERGIAARKWLRNRPEKVIAVVSHSGFMRIGVSYKNYNNADFRIFDFAEGFEKIGGKLVEWELTEANGGGK